MSTLPSKSKLDSYVRLGLLDGTRHPDLPLTIYTYTRFANYEGLWNRITTMCRGLVIDDNDRYVVRCMPKFFNEGERHAKCSPEFEESAFYQTEYYAKLDGSLIQVVNDPEYGLIVTSKGSFNSQYSRWGKDIIDERYSHDDFLPGITYVFELIHPENRIVLDYKGQRDLILLTTIDIETGQDPVITDVRFPTSRRISEAELTGYMDGDVEGVVIKRGRHRMKRKTDEYIRLHRIVTEFTRRRVWDSLRRGDTLEFADMPEEFDKWLKDTVAEIQGNFDAIFSKAEAELEETNSLSDKELGLRQGLKYKKIVFFLRAGKNPNETIWRMVKPKKEEA